MYERYDGGMHKEKKDMIMTYKSNEKFFLEGMHEKDRRN